MFKKIMYAALLGFTLSAQAQEEPAEVKPVELPAGYTSQLNVVYAKPEGWEGKMDLYLPPNAGKTTPVVINIHGGGWNHGTKESQTGFSTFFKAGFAVANVEYRLTPQATAPAAVEDCRCALVYLFNHAKELNINTDKVVVMGGSAGGHLALMTGLLANDHRFDGNCPTKEKIKVAAIIDKYGITDVWDWGYGSRITSKSAVNWLGKYSKDQKFAASVSPVTYLTKDAPPIFIVHGDADPTVPYQQSVELYNKLQELKVPSKFVTVPGGQHGKFDAETNRALNKDIIAFLKEQKII